MNNYNIPTLYIIITIIMCRITTYSIDSSWNNNIIISLLCNKYKQCLEWEKFILKYFITTRYITDACSIIYYTYTYILY